MASEGGCSSALSVWWQSASARACAAACSSSGAPARGKTVAPPSSSRTPLRVRVGARRHKRALRTLSLSRARSLVHARSLSRARGVARTDEDGYEALRLAVGVEVHALRHVGHAATAVGPTARAAAKRAAIDATAAVRGVVRVGQLDAAVERVRRAADECADAPLHVRGEAVGRRLDRNPLERRRVEAHCGRGAAGRMGRRGASWGGVGWRGAASWVCT
eukprot:1646195-Prymnesium_polylepis.1